MGTSSAFGGGKKYNPEVPSWAEENPDPPQPVAPVSVDGDRFITGRSHFNAFIKSGGTETALLRRAVYSYVSKTFGGPKQAANRMKSERAASVRLGRILLNAGTHGIQEVIKRLNLENLANRSIPEIYVALVDVICPTDGNLDDSMARDAYLEAVTEMGLEDLEQPSSATIAIIMERFISNAIKNRILNAIGQNIIILPADVRAAQNIETQLKEFIQGAVSDVIARNGKIFQADDMKVAIDNLYEGSYAVLEALAQEEANK